MNQTQRENHTAKERRLQVIFPLDLGLKLPEDDSLRLLIEITEEMDFRELYAAYERREAAGEATAKQLFQLVVFGFMNGHYSLRGISAACGYDIRMMYLLQGKKIPSHERFGDFIRNRMAGDVMENLFYQLVTKLKERGHISYANLFVDGTKIEANANRYSFVWEKTVTKNEAKMDVQIQMKLLELQTEYGFFETPPTLEGMLEYLQKKWDESSMQRVSGKGCRKSKLQKDLEKLEEYQNRREQYSRKKETLHGRPSYSKTDHDATFMRMKEDHMKNGQLKPGYNLQLGVEGEFIVTAGLFSERSDTLTVLPLLEHFQEKTGELPKRLITDSGYESEENYTRLEEMGIEAYIKPVNYEISKTKKYQRDRYKAENMPYDEETDSFICPNGNTLTAIGTAHRKSKSGFLSEVTLYRCTECRNCPLKAECTKSKNGRTIQRSKVLQRQREQSRERITSELGIQLRVNRSIQSEGTFGVLKQDWGFRRFLRRGQKNVYTEILIYAFAFNIQKLYAKDTNQRHGVILHQLKNAS